LATEDFMSIFIFLKGFLVGLFMCAPVGPIGLLSVKRTLTHGRAAGAVSVLGAAAADGLYCALAGFGITLISNFFERGHLWVELIGVLILILLGMKIFFSPPSPETPKNDTVGLVADFTSAFFLMLANPAPLLVYTAAFTALGVPGWKGDFLSTAVLVAGVVAGSALWAPILVGVTTLIRPQFNSYQLEIINKVAGAVLALLGLIFGFATLFGQHT
jgi:threonine/homoserine/homoserine lactone efflux protein